MGAVKELAIELEANMANAAELANRYDDASLAYRLGLLEACRMLSETQGRHLGNIPAWDALREAWLQVYDAAGYLREVSYREE